MKLPISAMVVGFNEEQFLPACLASIDFCNEILYTDLGSNDRSKEIARSYTDKIFERGKVPSCEMIQAEMINYIKNDWVIFIDPDEKVDAKLALDIKKNFPRYQMSKSIGAVKVPWQFYFKDHKLKGTVWGGINEKFFLVNKNRFVFEPVVHYGRKILPGFLTEEIELHNDNVMHHYWMDSYKVFFRKHKRYLKNEGRDRFNLGTRVGYKKLLATPFTEFTNSFFKRSGYKDGAIGFFLSVFWAYYQTRVALDILKIQKKEKVLVVP